MIGRRGNGLHFRMGGHIVQHTGAIVSTANNPAIGDNYRSHGHFVFLEGIHRLVKGALHVIFVSHFRLQVSGFRG